MLKYIKTNVKVYKIWFLRKIKGKKQNKTIVFNIPGFYFAKVPDFVS